MVMARGARREHLHHEIRAAPHPAAVGLGPVTDHQHVRLHDGIDVGVVLIGTGDPHVHGSDIGTAGLTFERIGQLPIAAGLLG